MTATPRRPEPAALAVVALLTAALLAGACRSVTVEPVSAAEVYRDRAVGAPEGTSLSGGAERVLDRYAPVLGDARDRPDAAYTDPGLPALLAADPELAAALAENALLAARAATDPERARAFLLEAVVLAWDGLAARLDDPRAPAIDSLAARLLGLYNRAVARFVGRVSSAQVLTARGDLPRLRGRIALTVAPPAAGLWDARAFDTLRPTDTLRLEGLRHRHRREGIGATVAAVRENEQRLPIEAFMPPEGIIYPATVILACGAQAGDVRSVTLSLVDPARRDRITVGTTELPLAGDFSAPYALLLSRSRLRLEGVKGAVRPKMMAERSGIDLLEPYDPDRTPLLMVHGLLSSPVAFVGITNDVWGDPRLRTRYQVWHYLYPSGLPFPWAARDLRAGLDRLRAITDPEGDDPAWQDMVVIAHSMGGLVARLLAVDSGEVLWSAMFRTPQEQLRIDPAQVERLRAILSFERRAQVRRVVFLATPHRGAERARGAIGKLANLLIKLPPEVRDLFDSIERRHPEAVSPAMRKVLEQGVPSSIQSLRPGSPLVRALADLPPHPDVVFHTILGDRGAGGGEFANDGYVSYRSAHLEGAASELVVPTGHGVYEHRRTLAELRRILHQHVDNAGTVPPGGDAR